MVTIFPQCLACTRLPALPGLENMICEALPTPA